MKTEGAKMVKVYSIRPDEVSRFVDSLQGLGISHCKTAGKILIFNKWNTIHEIFEIKEVYHDFLHQFPG